MDTNLQNKISLGVSTGLSLLFILLVTIAAINAPSTDNSSVWFIVVLIAGAFSISLFFNIQYYTVLKANKENKPLPGWVQKYGTAILVFAVIAIIIIAFMFMAATTVLVVDEEELSIHQLPFYIVFLVLLLLSLIAGIQNVRQYKKEKKKNSAIVNSLINTIGETSSV